MCCLLGLVTGLADTLLSLGLFDGWVVFMWLRLIFLILTCVYCLRF